MRIRLIIHFFKKVAEEINEGLKALKKNMEE